MKRLMKFNMKIFFFVYYKIIKFMDLFSLFDTIIYVGTLYTCTSTIQ